MTVEEFRRTMGEGKKPGKYRSVRTEVDGIVFDSKKEACRYSELKILERAGKIENLQRQVRYQIWVNHQKVTTYVADFVYTRAGKVVVEDAKGMRTREYKLKKRLMSIVLGIEIEEV